MNTDETSSGGTLIADTSGRTVNTGFGYGAEGYGDYGYSGFYESSLTLSWSTTTDGRMQHSTPGVGQQSVFFAGLGSTVFAVDTEDGDPVWEFDRSGLLSDSSPTVHDGTVFIGSGGGTIYALDAADGSVQWTVDTDSTIVSTPTVSDGNVYVGSNDGALRSLTTDGTVRWTAHLDAPVFAQPAVDSKHVYVTTHGGDIVAIEQDGGEEIWRYSTGTEFQDSSPVVDDGVVYVAGAVIHAIDATASAREGQAVLRWQREDFGGTVNSTPLVAADRLYVGSLDSRVYALDTSEDGTLLWTHQMESAVVADPAMYGGRLVVASLDGTVALIDVDSGLESGSTVIDASVRSSPAVYDEKICLPTEAGFVVTLTTSG